MKICACVAEYNPFHLGHVKHINYIKNELKADKLIVIMSGNFTQRGEPAVLDKFTRAKHAIIAGADAVIELPTVFATANAESFAKGAISVLNGLNCVDELCFGVESGDAEAYISLAKALNDESKDFKRALKARLEEGVSLAKAKFLAVKDTKGEGYDESLISSPNNILGLEYVKALLKSGSRIRPVPMLREGDHNSIILKKGVTSATSIRKTIKAGQIKKLKKCVPPYVYRDLKEYPYAFDNMIAARVLTASAEEMAKLPDCTEGLENRIKALSKDNRDLDSLVAKVATKRYTETRVRRILTANFLGVTQDFLTECLNSPTYAKILAVNADGKDIIPLIAEKAVLPVLTRKSDAAALKKAAEKSFNLDVLANDLYNLATKDDKNENLMLTV